MRQTLDIIVSAAFLYDFGKLAIADVSSYFKEGTALDEEAGVRGFTLYFANSAMSMLPSCLSKNIC